MQDELLKLINEERKLLHDISNKLTIVEGFSRFLQKKAERSVLNDSDILKISKIVDASKIINELVIARREKIHKLEDKLD